MPEIDLYAWIGDDEYNQPDEDGRLTGIKQARTPLGYIPLVSTRRHRMTRAELRAQLQAQADQYGKPIRLARFVYAEDLETITPRPRG